MWSVAGGACTALAALQSSLRVSEQWLEDFRDHRGWVALSTSTVLMPALRVAGTYRRRRTSRAAIACQEGTAADCSHDCQALIFLSLC